MKVPPKGAFMITITIIFLLLKHYVVRQWCISCKLRQISNRDIKLAVFPAFHILRSVPKNHCFFCFFDRKLLKTRLGGFSVGFWCWPTQYKISISFWNLRYEMDHTCCWLFLPFWVSISSHSFPRQSFCCFFMFFTKEYINFAYLSEKSTWFGSEICFGYFEHIWKDFSDYQVKTN